MSKSERIKYLNELRGSGEKIVQIKPTLHFTEKEEVEIYDKIGRMSFSQFLETLTRLVLKGKIVLEKLLKEEKKK